MFGADVEKVLDESLSRLKLVVAVAAMGLTPMLPVMADAGTDASLGEDGEVAGKAEKHGIDGCRGREHEGRQDALERCHVLGWMGCWVRTDCLFEEVYHPLFGLRGFV